MGKLCWVGNIPEGLSPEELSENFKQAGTVKKANFMKGNTACIEYSTADEVQQAITMFNGADVNGSALHVDVWTGGGGSGRSGGGSGGSAAPASTDVEEFIMSS